MKKTKKVIKLKKEVKIIIVKIVSILLITMILINLLKNNDAQDLNVYRYNIIMMMSYFIITSIILIIFRKKRGEKENENI